MAGRFAASKFKNTHPKTPKREDCLTDLPIGGVSSTNDAIKSGRHHIAFHVDGESGKLGILRNDVTGRKTREDLSILSAHTDGVIDFGFLPFQRDVLATVGHSDDLRLWRLQSEDENGNPSVTAAGNGIDIGENGGECLMIHKTAADIIAVGSIQGAYLIDGSAGKMISQLRTGWDERAGSGDWDGEGKTLLVQDRANRLAVFDPRAGLDPVEKVETVQSGRGRETRAMYLGSEGRILTSGFSKMRQREIFLYDVRKVGSPLHVQQFESSTGLIIPLYDPDTKLIFLAGKGSQKIHLCELLNKTPYLGEVGNINTTEQTLGACLLPKWSMDVMNGEVVRVMQLNRNSIFPVSCCVPRKTYRDFIPELFPPTAACVPGSTAAKWLAGDNTAPPKYSLDPADAGKVEREPVSDSPRLPPVRTFTKETVSDIIQEQHTPLKPAQSEPKRNGTNGVNGSNGVHKETSDPIHYRSNERNGQNGSPKPMIDGTGDKPAKIDLTVPYAERPRSEFVPLPAPKVQLRSTLDGGMPASRPPAANRQTIAVAPGASLFGARRTKFKHTSVKVETTKDKIFYNIRKVNTQLPLECGGFTISDLWAAVPIGGASGLIAIFDLTAPQKAPDGVIPGLENGGTIGDLKWDPFNPSRLLIGLDTGILNIWTVPSQGVSEILTSPDKSWAAHGSKLTNIEWNPVASDVIASSGLDGEVRLWDASEANPQARILIPHPSALIAIAWSAHGDRMATACKDGSLRIFRPLESTKAVVEANILGSTKAARLVWVLNDEFILLSGFSRSSQRELSLLRAETLEVVATKQFDQASVLLIPQYDFDTNLIYLTGKGDVTLQMFEVIDEAPWFLDIPAWKGLQPHQGIAFHHKHLCDVAKVEVARAWRLKLNEIQPMSFTVPRRHLDKFQNDLFPEAIARWSPASSANDWFNGRCDGARFQDLNPGLDLLYPSNSNGSSPPQTIVPIKSANPTKPRVLETPTSLRESIPVRKTDLMSSIGGKMDALAEDRGMEQDKFEGVAEEEWQEI